MTNIVFPVMIITIVNGCSLLVPIEFGKRLSFGISLLLFAMRSTLPFIG
jgi:hypothetical protein